MRMKNTAVRSAVIVAILLISLGIGYVYQEICHKIDIQHHPIQYAEYVSRYAAEYGVPEYILYAVIKTESDFDSSKLSENGEIGLMQISPDTFSKLLSMTKESHDTGILYDPETNIRYGAYRLSYLYTEYSRWNTVFAAWKIGQDTVESWQADPALVDEMGNLTVIPEAEVADYVESLNETMEMYRKLYYKES